MRIPLSWLAEYVDLESLDPEDVLAKLVRVGLEEEDIIRPAVTGPVVVGQVLERVPEPQKNGKTINWCQVRVAPEGQPSADGGADVHGIVCGAHNFEVGDKVVVTLPGAVLPGDFEIAARKTYGHLSDGMIASAKELGMGEDHTGIIVLSRLGLDPEVGQDALALLHLDEQAVEINVTPDRGYCFSIRGVAREYGHSTSAAFRDPAAQVEPRAATGYQVSIDDHAPIRGRLGVRRFVTRVVEGVDPSLPTPAWMAQRLRLAGIRSISVIVDITNYVMLELGNPIHAYDLDTLRGGITVRRAEPGERLTTLDGQDRALDPEDLLITDDRGAIGLAGVMGGQETEVTDATRNVLVEAAVFEPVSIARTARRHKLPSEASKRYERGVDPLVSAAAAERVVQLLERYAGGTATDCGSDWSADDLAAPAIPLPLGFASSLVGVAYTEEQVVGTLEAIGCSVDRDGDALNVTPPSWRPDLTDKTDLVEEVARIVGYDHIPSVLPVAPSGRGLTFAQAARRRVADQLAGAGQVEVLGYPFVTEAQNALFTEDGRAKPAVTLANPLDAQVPYLRQSLLPGLLLIAKRNVERGLVDLSIFETGAVFFPVAEDRVLAQTPPGGVLPAEETLRRLYEAVPTQPRHIAGVATGQAVAKQPGQPQLKVDWRDAIVAVRQTARALGVEVGIEQGAMGGMHPGRIAIVTVAGPDGTPRRVGFAGELHPDTVKAHSLHGRVAAWELDLDALVAAAPSHVVAGPVGTMPAATQDLSLVVDETIPAGTVLATVVEGAGDLLESAQLVDDFRGETVGEGKKSLTFALRFRAPDRTLTAAEASEARDAAVALAAERHGATIRA